QFKSFRFNPNYFRLFTDQAFRVISFAQTKNYFTFFSPALQRERRTIANLRGSLQEKFTFTAKLTKNELRLCI
ncbi:MAG: hypothetical protein WA071_24735, partial [Undibacterium umbellatum]|uniref:hypothetical protein n=1 Tax=Undibacterium umbellatum TaxID=2762300 RepID=UPI003BB6B296